MWEYATRDVRSLGPDDSLHDVIELMTTGGFRHVPIVDDDRRLVGIVSDRDVRHLLPPPGSDPEAFESFAAATAVREVMTKSPLRLERTDSLEHALRVVLEHRVGALPVVEDGRLVGILSQIDLLRAFAERLGTAGSGGPPKETVRSVVRVVEPDRDLRTAVVGILRAEGHEVTGHPSLDLLIDAEENPVGLVLLSAHASAREDPLELLSRRFPRAAVVMTRHGASTDEGLRDRGPLSLPCPRGVLVERVRGELLRAEEHVGLEEDVAPRTQTIDISVDAPRRVLVVDKDPLCRRLLSHHFRRLACEVHEASDGHSALSRLALEVFDIVTLELDLPYRSGFDLLEFARRAPERSPMMVVVSASRDDEDVLRAFACGARDFIEKPLVPKAVALRVYRLLEG